MTELPADGHGRGNALPEVHGSVAVPRSPSAWRRLFAFAGPAYMVSVGYMDPGNWATDIEGGSRFAYDLLWVLMMANLMAILLQTLSARLGIVTGRDLAQACREAYPRPNAMMLWILCEVAIAACDLAEVLGTAIGLNLLFGLPMMVGVLITALDVFVLLAIQRLGIRRMEAFILALVATIGACFVFEIFLAKPDWGGILGGFRPQLPSLEALYVAIGMLGATVMPHNLYLHSALVQTRQVGRTREGMREANKFNLIDSAVALNGAFLVNAAILILAAATFHRHGRVVAELQEAHSLLSPLLGMQFAGVAFAVALLCAGQSSTLTGTLAGQVVMEGFLRFRMRPWVRRLLTRSVAIVPAVITIAMFGEHGTYKLLILSQVILSLQLPFAVIPLVHFTGDRAKMGEFANRTAVKWLAGAIAVVIVALNLRLVAGIVPGWIATLPGWSTRALVTAGLVVVGLLLVYVIFHPWLRRIGFAPREAPLPAAEPAAAGARSYRKIAAAVAVDAGDRAVLAHAISFARAQGRPLLLVHVAEGFGPRYFGSQSADEETRDDRRYLEILRGQAAAAGVEAEVKLLYGDPVEQLARLAESENLDLLVMGAHGHRLLGDLVFGSTVSPLRHRVKTPMLVVRADESEN